MSTRTDALVSQQETGKMTASISPHYDRLPPGGGVTTFKSPSRSSASERTANVRSLLKD